MAKCNVYLLLFATLLFSQATTSISGIVADPTGAAVPAADIQVAEAATGRILKTITNERGEWVIPSMPAGAYRVTVTKSGFKAGMVDGVELNAGTPASVNIKLEIGAATETVEVTSGAEIVQASSATVSSTLTGRQVNELPFATRNAIELMVTQPGTQTPTNPRSSTINGLPKGALNITIDGMNSQDNMLKSSDGFFSYIMPSVDSLEEATLTTAAGGVDATSQGGAQIRFVTKSGTNTFHGGALYQMRNTAFNANYYFNNINGQPRDVVHLRQYGGRLGGPIIKDKLFFFVNHERYRFPGTSTYSRTVLTDDARSGIYKWKDSAGAVQQRNLYALVGAVTPPAGARYPTTPDPIAAKTFADIAALRGNGILRSNSITGNDYNTDNLSYQPSGLDLRDFYTTRWDYNLSFKHHISFVYNYDKYDSTPDFLNNIVPVYPGTGTVLGTTVNTGQRSNRFAGTVSLRSALSARITNELRGGVNGGTVLFFDAIAPGLFAPWRGYVPSFGSGLSGVTTNSGPQRRNAPIKDMSDTFSFVKGSHQFSVGLNYNQVSTFQQIQGSAMFPGVTFGIATNDPIANGNTSLFTTTNFPGATQSQLNSASGLYATLTGRVSSFTRSVALDEATKKYGATAPVDRDHIREIGLFIQDTWRVHPNLTATIGLRYEREFAFVNENGLYSQVGLAGIWGLSGIGNLFKPGTLTGIAPTYHKLDPNNTYKIPKIWAPSVGLAWQLPKMGGFLGKVFGERAGASVLRAGYAIASVREGMNVLTSTYGGNQGLTVSTSIDPSTFPADFGAPGSVLFRDATLPVRSGVPSTPQYPIVPTFTNSLNDFDPNLKLGYVQSWNIGLQRELGRNSVVEVRFTGNHGVHLWQRYSLQETNIFENGFLDEFKVAANNLAIARQTNPSSNNFGNQGLPGQKAIPILQIGLGTTCCNDSATANNLTLGQAGTLAGNIAGNATRMAALANAGYPSNLFRVNPTVGGGAANLVTNANSSFYDALQVEFRRRISGGLLVQGSYAFAKSISTGATNSSTTAAQPTTLRNLRLDHTPEGFDIRNAIKMNWIYELPFGPHRALLGGMHNPIARKMLEGWELAGVARLQSGTPFYWSSFATFNTNGSGVILHNITAGQIQDMVGIYKITGADGKGLVYFLPPPTPGAKVGDNFITNTQAAFNANGLNPSQVDQTKPYIGPASAGQMGWLGYFYNPWRHFFDLSLIKKTKIHERGEIEFRAQALNVLNMVNFNAGSGNTSSSFGQITSAYRDISGTVDPGGRMLEFVLKINF
jgi:hypothetical protein